MDLEVDNGEYQEGLPQLMDIATPESSLARDQLEKTINSAIDALPEELKVAVTLREFDGLSYEDIAAIMQCPVGTVRSRIFRARESIEKRIDAMD